MTGKALVYTEVSQAIDTEAREKWGFNTFALVEAAGRGCAGAVTAAFPRLFSGGAMRITAAAGPGNNGADALVMLRYWILSGLAEPALSAVVVSRLPDSGDCSPLSETLKSLEKMNVPVTVWDSGGGEKTGSPSIGAFSKADIIIDGIAGSGVSGPLRGSLKEMAEAVNALETPFVISVDMPSGSSDEWEPGMPIVRAAVTTAIEPLKLCLYHPKARLFCGTILPVRNVFPAALIEKHKGPELLDWESARTLIPPVRADAYKHLRGAVEIRAGAPGASGAALIAARGAQAAGAGLVRLVVDDEIYPILASGAGGVMVAPESLENTPGRFKPGALLLGPGWGRTGGRAARLEKSLELEKNGVPLVLDADAIALAKDKQFHGNAILTPHAGEFSEYTGISVEEILSRPAPLLLETAEKKKAVIILKGHVIFVAGFDGRLAVIDGIAPVLASGGSGDLLAGFCAAIAARTAGRGGGGGDCYSCACAAAALLIAAGKSPDLALRFTDPLEIAGAAADLAGRAWLCPKEGGNGCF
ncbi:MAG: bifunctional ADP-dependent NAD(P)H-hydrate dehydratase/NAD(P)H-hydrate epimerase [Treponema sp.]|jgi:NAD(P)H-hydrate epimerase|nr:bifunctional ADP-dependent NAD(P)H-hydrate dehydratase/NAD(P)H-hydrate epimerase [Treponema sp.]